MPRTSGAAARIVREHLPGFLERLEVEAHTSLPGFVRAELEGFADCGNFERGFVLLACERCKQDLRVPFSCKGRGICPSCTGRRMAESAALLVDHRLPAVTYRQWVLTFPGPMAVRLGYDATLLDAVCKRFAARVMQTLRHRTKQAHDLASVAALHPGIVLVVQRFRSDLGLFVHLHLLVTDGCFEAPASSDAPPPFHRAEGLDETHLLDTLAKVHRDLAPLLGDEAPEPDEDIAAFVSFGQRPLAFVETDRESSEPEAKPMTVAGFGMQLHAATVVDGRDRRRLEHVCKYLLRPAFAHDAVEALEGGRVRVHFKAPSFGGRTFADMDRDTFVARLAALVPPPRLHLVRYYGVFANQHGLRDHIVPPFEPAGPVQLRLFDRTDRPTLTLPSLDPLRRRAGTPTRIPWAALLARTFALDLARCPTCDGPLRLRELVTTPEKIRQHLHGARGPPSPRPSPPGQRHLFEHGPDSAAPFA